MLLIGGGDDAFLGRRKRDDEEDHAEHAEDAHHSLVRARVVVPWRPVAEVFEHLRRDRLHDERCRDRQHKSVRGQAGAVGQVAGHHAAECRVWQVVRRVDQHQQQVRDVRVRQLPGIAEVRCRERDHRHDAVRYCSSDDPRPELAEAALGAVGENAEHGVEKSIGAPGDQQQQGGGRCSKAERVRVEAQLEHDQRLENEIRRRVTEAVADFFFNRESL